MFVIPGIMISQDMDAIFQCWRKYLNFRAVSPHLICFEFCLNVDSSLVVYMISALVSVQ